MDRFFSLLSLETNENIHTYIYIYTWLIPSKILFLSPFSCQNISTRSYSNFFPPSFIKVHGNSSTRERTRTREMEVRDIYIYIHPLLSRFSFAIFTISRSNDIGTEFLQTRKLLRDVSLSRNEDETRSLVYLFRIQGVSGGWSKEFR